MSLGKNVKHLRSLAGIALEPMAEAMGMERAAGRQKIYALETRGSRKSDIASDLAKYFGVPVETLLNEDLTTLTLESWGAIKAETFQRAHQTEKNGNVQPLFMESIGAGRGQDSSKRGVVAATKRIQAAMSPQSVAANELAVKAGVDESIAELWLRGEGPEPSLSQAVALQNHYGINAVWIANGQGEPGVAIRYADEWNPIPITNWKAIPVVGHAQLGDNGFWADLEYPVGHGEGFVSFPSNDPDAYALKCEGDSMRPRIKAGEFVVIEPNHEPEPGDEVLVKSIDGRVMVKEFLYKRAGRTHLISTNDTHPPVAFTDAEIEKMHYVAGIAKRAMWRPD